MLLFGRISLVFNSHSGKCHRRKKQMKKFFVLVISMMSLTTFSHADNKSDFQKKDSKDLIQFTPKGDKSRAPIDFGHGILYFYQYGKDFGEALSIFLRLNPHLKVLSIASDDTDYFGSTHGYFVIVEKR